MDATGNECNSTADVATVASEGGTTFVPARAPTGETNKAASCGKCTVKTTAETRHVAPRHRVKQG
jgi:hypothetical protein